MSVLKELMQDLQAEAALPVHHEDEEFNAYDMSGGNYDDAYRLGVDAGRRELAREVLAVLEEGG